MNNQLYLECYAGISGDMMVAALLDLGADQKVLENALRSLHVNGFHIHISRVKKVSLDACDFHVQLDTVHENHDHEMQYLHGEKKHIHQHNQKEHHHSHSHRNLADILHIIENADITDHAKKISSHIFQILAEAEAKAHGTDISEVHFHEVGALDSIVDIIAVAVCLDNLSIDEVIVPVLHEGTGFVRCQHGMIPIPVPAVSNIAAAYGIKLHITNTEGEFVTPTGAAIVAAIKTKDTLPEKFQIQKIGLGAGKRSYEKPSILRALLIKEEINSNQDFVYKLESNLDDCTGEALGYVMERLLKAGAKDVNYMPIFMKKNRPAYQLNVICKQEDVENLEQIIFEETTTIGIRKQVIERTILKREIKNIQTSLGEVLVKVCYLSKGKRYYPEYNSLIHICEESKLSYQEAYQQVVNECNNKEV